MNHMFCFDGFQENLAICIALFGRPILDSILRSFINVDGICVFGILVIDSNLSLSFSHTGIIARTVMTFLRPISFLLHPISFLLHPLSCLLRPILFLPPLSFLLPSLSFISALYISPLSTARFIWHPNRNPAAHFAAIYVLEYFYVMKYFYMEYVLENPKRSLRTPFRSQSNVMVPMSAIVLNVLNGLLLGTYLSSPLAVQYLGKAYSETTHWAGVSFGVIGLAQLISKQSSIRPIDLAVSV